MHATMNAPTGFGEEYGTLVNTVTPIVASILQSRQSQGAPWMGSQGWAGGFPQQGWGGGVPQQGWGGGPGMQEIGPIVAAIVPAVLAKIQQQPYLQQPYQPYLPGLQPQLFSQQQPFAQQPFFSQPPFGQQQPFGQQPYGQPPFGQQQPFGQQAYGQPPFSMLQGGVPPYELAQIVSTIVPMVASLVQSRSYQGHFGQFLPRAA